MHRHSWKAVAALLMIAAGSGTALAIAQVDNSPPASTVTATQPAAAAPNRSTASTVDPELSARIAVLRKAPDAGAPATTPGAAHFGADPNLARAALAADGQKVYLTPANGALCLQSASFGTCNDTASVLDGHLVSVTYCSPTLAAGHNRVTGVVPDGVSSVTETMVAGETSVPVQDNVYDLDSTSIPVEITWGDVHIPLPAPPEGACVSGS